MRTAIFTCLVFLLPSCNSSNNIPAGKVPVNDSPLAMAPLVKEPVGELKPTVVLPITALHTEDGIPEEMEGFEYEANDTIKAGKEMSEQLGAYGAAYLVWLGPKNWTGDGAYGADGNIRVTLLPKGGSEKLGPHIFIYEAPACQSCLLSAAAPYFPEAMKDYNENYNADNSDPVKIHEGLKIHAILPSLVTYTEPAGSGLLKQGVAFYGGTEERDTYFSGMDIVLPDSDGKLATFLMEWYINFRELK